jgi:protein-disulfide isomerase
MAAYCAGEQNKFWEMHDKLFQNQSDTFGNDKNQLAALAQQLGVYNQEFQTCFDQQKYLPQIQKNFTDSELLGVAGTPTWFINGEKIEGELSVTGLEKLIAPYLR